MSCLHLEVILLLVLISYVSVYSLQCWHCIADDCSDDPTENYKASKKPCNPGQACQKVYFEMIEETEQGNLKHTSTVRGCSTMCETRNDFENCSDVQRTSRGCVRKDCCSDGDLCNHASRVSHVSLFPVILTQCLLYVIIVKIANV